MADCQGSTGAFAVLLQTANLPSSVENNMLKPHPTDREIGLKSALAWFWARFAIVALCHAENAVTLWLAKMQAAV
jgi:hypothetical protein